MRRCLSILMLSIAVCAECRAQAAVQSSTVPAADERLPMLAPVVVTATRVEQGSADLPVSINAIGQESIQQANAMVNLSETLVRAPGVVVQNRQNYAQDLQVSVRGFGARSTFGVRGVRLYADGIPATMPDGQGQTSHFDLGSAKRIEVMRGPFSALYGNSSGGVISVFTEDGEPGSQLAPYAQYGSDGASHAGVKASGQRGLLNYVVSASRFRTDGYREHSAATRDTQNAKLRTYIGNDTSLTIVGNAVSMHDVQDPLGLTRAQFESNPRGVDQSAVLFNTRKSVDQQQLGLNYEKILNDNDSLHAVVYGGRRATVQYLVIPPGAQLAPTSGGGVVDLGRRYAGIDLRWSRKQALANGTWQWTAGISIDTLDEDRLGFENFVGPLIGVRGSLRRDETNTARNIDQYLQAQWQPEGRWTLLAGIRHSHVHIASHDHYVVPGNGDDSGSVDYYALNPVFGASWKLLDTVRLYASYGKGFETPTLNELSYRLGGGIAASGFNAALKPARSDNLEAGIKAAFGEHVRANLAVFHIDTEDELTVLSNTAGRAVFQNAGNTRRDGIELEVEGKWPNGVGTLLSYARTRARYAEEFCNGACSPGTRVQAGNRIPGVPDSTMYGELSWQDRASGFSVALEGKYIGKVVVDDINSDAAAAYFVANARASLEQKTHRWTLREFVRIDNLAGRSYAGSVIVNESNRRFFEPAPQRIYLAGVTLSFAW